VTTFVLLRFDDDGHAERFQRGLADELVVIDDPRLRDAGLPLVRASVTWTYRDSPHETEEP